MKMPSHLKWKATGRTLGEGGQAAVQQVVAKDMLDGPVYAMKSLSSDKPRKDYERFAREIEAIKNLNHPYIIKVVDHSDADADFHFYVMEYIEGAKTLKYLIESSQNPFERDPYKSIDLFLKLADVVRHCKKANVVHRDLSPANILILPDLSIKVIDFGVCQLGDYETITLTDEGVGTPNYMAPECESGAEGDIGPWSDLYSAGKVLWSALVSMIAFAREAPVYNAKSMTKLFPNESELWHLNHIFEKTIRRNPSDRWETGEDALLGASRIRYLISSGRLPLELIQQVCPICGYGELTSFEQSHVVFGNPNPPGIISLQCNYCGHCFAVNRNAVKERLAQRVKFE